MLPATRKTPQGENEPHASQAPAATTRLPSKALNWGLHHVVTILGVFSGNDARASVSSDGAVVNGGVRRRNRDETRLGLQAINRCRELRIDSKLTLFEDTIEDNIVLGHSYSSYSDVRWTLRFTALEENADAVQQRPSPDSSPEKILAPAHIMGILLTRAILAHASNSDPWRHHSQHATNLRETFFMP